MVKRFVTIAICYVTDDFRGKALSKTPASWSCTRQMGFFFYYFRKCVCVHLFWFVPLALAWVSSLFNDRTCRQFLFRGVAANPTIMTPDIFPLFVCCFFSSRESQKVCRNSGKSILTSAYQMKKTTLQEHAMNVV